MSYSYPSDWYWQVTGSSPSTQVWKGSTGAFVANNTASFTTWMTDLCGDVVANAGLCALVSNATDNGSGLVRITTDRATGWQTGDIKTVAATGGVAAAVGTWTITRIAENVFDLQASVFAGTYTSGGVMGSGSVIATEAALYSLIDDHNASLAASGAFGGVQIVASQNGVLVNPIKDLIQVTWSSAGVPTLALPPLNRFGAPPLGHKVTIQFIGSSGPLTIFKQDGVTQVGAKLYVATDTITITPTDNTTANGGWEVESYSRATLVPGAQALGRILIGQGSGNVESWQEVVGDGALASDGTLTLANIFGQSAVMLNGTIVESHAANAVTFAVKTLAGADPSAASPVRFAFRSATLASGVFVVRSVTAALSITIPSGATLGHASGRDQQVFVYAIDNAGTVELAVSNKFFDRSVRRVTTTTIGAGSTSATAIYSTTGRTNVAWMPIARAVSNQTAAGTWAASPTQIDLAPFDLPTNYINVTRNNVDQTIADAVSTKIQFTTEVSDTDGVYDNATNYRYQPNVSGKYLVHSETMWTTTLGSGILGAGLFKNGVEYAFPLDSSGGTSPGEHMTIIVDMNGSTDYLEFYVFQNSGGNADLAGAVTRTQATAYRIGP